MYYNKADKKIRSNVLFIMKEIGLNLYSVRNLIGTEEELITTAQKLKDMGYSFFQYSGAMFDPKRIKRMVDEVGTPVRLTHMDKDRLLNETEKVCEENLYFGNTNIGLGSMSTEVINDEKMCKEYIEKYNKAGEIMCKYGCQFYWHHHNFEFIQYNGQTVMDFVIDNAPYINFTLDTYWVQLGGMNVIEYLERLSGRIGCVHLKDFKTRYNTEIWKYEPEIESVGYGVMNFQSIINKMREVGVQYYFVEQDNAADKPDTLHQVERSIQYLKKEIK